MTVRRRTGIILIIFTAIALWVGGGLIGYSYAELHPEVIWKWIVVSEPAPDPVVVHVPGPTKYVHVRVPRHCPDQGSIADALNGYEKRALQQ